MATDKTTLHFRKEVLGFHPFKTKYKEALITLRGEEDVPPSKWGLSSLQQLYPRISPKMWRGKTHLPRTIIISNLFNRTPTPTEEGWSVQKTQTLDFRGRKLTYNSHNGTDFAIPVGTTVQTAAAGKVLAILSQFNRGGLKIFIDHGQGLMTCYAHLARALVNVGDVLKRGEPIALSGYSGIDGMITYPFGIPHVHFNVWLNSVPIDPFALGDEVSLWHGGELPQSPKDNTSQYTPSAYDATKVDLAISRCKTPFVKERLSSISDIATRAVHTIIEQNYYPTRFVQHTNVYANDYPRQAMLDLPFSSVDFDGLVFLDDLLSK
jgi:murein DD-endopeptidase MepM/ murein hydrolase activator NlpD